MITAKLVLVNGQPIKSSDALPAQAQIEVTLPPPEELALVPESRVLEILFEDEHLLVLNKPAGLTVHPSTTQKSGTLVHALLARPGSLSQIGGKIRPGIVHRLDKDTSGSLVISKTDRAHEGLAKLFAAHELEREYWALVYGSPRFSEVAHRVETLIGRHPQDRQRMSAEVKRGRTAISLFRTLERYGRSGHTPFAALVAARLETGRTHQIRVHLTQLGNSVLGDPLYGTPTTHQPKWKALPVEIQVLVRALQGQALHARLLAFKHPITGREVRCEATPPPAFQALWDGLRSYA